MIKLTLVGDLHTKNDNLEKIGAIFDLIDGLGHSVVLLGDVFHTKEVIRGKCLNYVFDRISQSKLQFYILVGNHDWFNLECTEHSLELFKTLPNVDVIDRPQTTIFIDSNLVNNTPASGIERRVTFLPYYHDFDKFREAVANTKHDSVLIMHQGITGFDYGNGHIAENEVALEELRKFELVVSGHFHKYQENSNLVYLGTPFSHDFGESNQTKYIGLLDIETLKIDLIPMRLPQHKTLEFNCDSGSQISYEETDIVRIVLTGREASVKAFDRSNFPRAKIIERPDRELADVDIVSETDSNPKKFVSWAKNVKQLDDETISLGLQLLEEVDV